MITRLRVGVTGHRPALLEGTDVDALAARLAALFATLEDSLRTAAGGGAASGQAVTLVTCGAAGVDTMAIAIARAQGWAHETVLPFPPADYAGDFAAQPEMETYRHNLQTAHRVFALDGLRDNRADADTQDRNPRESRAYERAGRILLAQSDVLVGVWNGQPAAGPGGTGQVVAEAVLAGIPVIHLPLQPDAPVQLLWSGLNDHALGEDTLETVARAGLDRTDDMFRALPGVCGADTSPGRSGGARRPGWLETSLALPYRALLWLTRARAPAASFGASHGEVAPDPRLATLFAAADSAACAAAAAYRGAYVANFALAAAAVLVSLSGLVLPLAAKPFLLATEIALIAVILGVTSLGRRLDWHRSWIEQRQLAERLRCLGIAARLGDLCLRGQGAGTLAAVQDEACTAARELGLPAATVTAAWLDEVRGDLLALTADQRGYFAREAQTMHRLDHRLHRAGVVLFAATALVCVGFLGFEAWLGLTGQHLAEDRLHHLALWVTLFTAAFPTLGAALHGIRMQGDFSGAAERSHAVDAQLAGIEQALRDEPGDFDRMLVRMRRVMGLLTEDLDSWTYTYQGRPLVLPG